MRFFSVPGEGRLREYKEKEKKRRMRRELGPGVLGGKCTDVKDVH